MAIRKQLGRIDNSISGYAQLIALYNELSNASFERIEVNIQSWFSANMSAALACVLDKVADQINDVRVIASTSSTAKILQKNEFLTYYGHDREQDIHHTTIRFQKLTAEDGRSFQDYVMGELLERSELPTMTAGVKEAMATGIYEIFVNAQIHSDCSNIYTCGQFFPKKNLIEFTIVDNGIGFQEKINKRFGSQLLASQAIKWAVRDGSTTKQEVTGGIGLALLKEFVQQNKGRMQIISGNGFYQFSVGGEHLQQFQNPFPGTIVNLEFRTDDPLSYLLTSEDAPDPSEIF